MFHVVDAVSIANFHVFFWVFECRLVDTMISDVVLDGRSDTTIRENGVSKALSRAMSRGQTRLEKKSAWPFDFYQAGAFFPVDYQYRWTPYTTSTGETQLTMMHAIAYAEDGSEFGADQMFHRKSMRLAHKTAHQAYMYQLKLTKRD